jgi:hypothetical protein
MDLFASIYQFFENLLGLFNQDYSIIFEDIYALGVYTKMGFSCLIVPVIVMAIFYYLYQNPYATILHWGVGLIIGLVIIAMITVNILRLDLAVYLLDDDPAVSGFTNKLIVSYTFINVFLGGIIGFLASLLLRLNSKVQMHLPF